MKALLSQRPKRVSHLLKDNLPGSSEFYLSTLPQGYKNILVTGRGNISSIGFLLYKQK